MKKRLQGIVAAMAVAFVLTACGEEGGATQTTTTASLTAAAENGNEIVVDDRGVPALNVPLPNGFHKDEDTSGSDLFYTDDYPDDMTNMVVGVFDYDAYGVSFEKEKFEEVFQQGYEEAGCPIANLTVLKFDAAKLEEFDTLLVDCTYEMEGTAYRQVEYLAQVGTRTYVQTYTQAGIEETQHLKDFMNSIVNASIIYEE